MEYLDFEKELEELDLQIKNTKEAGEKTNSDMTKVLKELKNKYNQKKKKFIKIYHHGKKYKFHDTLTDHTPLII